MQERGIRLIGRGLWYISAAHTLEEIDYCVGVTSEVLATRRFTLLRIEVEGARVAMAPRDAGHPEWERAWYAPCREFPSLKRP